MKQKFLDTLTKLEQQAKEEIRRIVSSKNEVVLFEPDPNQEDEWTKDIYDEIPDFAFYSKHGFVDYAAIRVVSVEDDEIKVTGILKGDNYPGEVTINLNEMESYSILALAD